MNKAIIYIFATLTMTSPSVMDAQGPKGNKRFNLEAFESKKGAFLTAELELTPDEAAEFIPLCNELQRKNLKSVRIVVANINSSKERKGKTRMFLTTLTRKR